MTPEMSQEPRLRRRYVMVGHPPGAPVGRRRGAGRLADAGSAEQIHLSPNAATRCFRP